MKYNIVAVAVMLVFVLLMGYAVIAPELNTNKIKTVSEWNDIFDMDCSCGNHIHCEPYDKNHYKIVCVHCGKVYEKDWDISRYE